MKENTSSENLFVFSKSLYCKKNINLCVFGFVCKVELPQLRIVLMLCPTGAIALVLTQANDIFALVLPAGLGDETSQVSNIFLLLLIHPFIY